MSRKRRTLDFALAAFLLLLPALILRSSLKDPEHLTRFDRAVLRVSSPIQAVVSWVVTGVGDLWTDYVWLVGVEDENDELRAANLRLREELRAAQDKAHRLDEVEELLDFKKGQRAETAAAHIISATVNRHFRVTRLRIDRGEDKVRVGMPVINSQGLVGRVVRTYGAYSDVLLVSDPRSSVDVVIPRTGGRGVLSGLNLDDSYLCRIEYLEKGTPVEVGDKVRTSGLGENFPSGLIVGEITEVVDASSGLYQDVRVRPSVDFSSLESVLVLVAPPPKPDPRAGVRRSSKAAHSMEAF